jgi:hypothetical protein
MEWKVMPPSARGNGIEVRRRPWSMNDPAAEFSPSGSCLMYVGDDDPNKVPAMTNLLTVRKQQRRLRQCRDIRRDKVNAVRAALDAGTYVNDLKLAVAIDRLIDAATGKSGPREE